MEQRKRLKALLMNKGFGVEGAEIAIDAIWEYLQNERAKAIKEFADKLKDGYSDFDERYEVILYDNLVCAIDDLADEMGCGG